MFNIDTVWGGGNRMKFENLVFEKCKEIDDFRFYNELNEVDGFTDFKYVLSRYFPLLNEFEIFEPMFDKAYDFEGDLCRVFKDGKTGLIDRSFEIVEECIWDMICINEYSYWLYKDNVKVVKLYRGKK